MLEKSGFSGIWANVLRKVIVPLAECVPWCLAVNAPLCTLAVRLRSARLPPTATESSYRSPHVGTIFDTSVVGEVEFPHAVVLNIIAIHEINKMIFCFILFLLKMIRNTTRVFLSCLIDCVGIN